MRFCLPMRSEVTCEGDGAAERLRGGEGFGDGGCEVG